MAKPIEGGNRIPEINRLPAGMKARFMAGRLSRIFFALSIACDVLTLACVVSPIIATLLYVLLFIVLLASLGLILLFIPEYWTFLQSGAIWDFAAGALALAPVAAAVGAFFSVLGLVCTLLEPSHRRGLGKTIFLSINAGLLIIALIVILVVVMK